MDRINRWFNVDVQWKCFSNWKGISGKGKERPWLGIFNFMQKFYGTPLSSSSSLIGLGGLGDAIVGDSV